MQFNKTTLYLIVFFFLFSMSSCSTKKFVLTRRYKKMKIEEVSNALIKKLVNVKFSSFEKERIHKNPIDKTIFDLSSEGQASLIKKLADTNSSKKLIANIREKLSLSKRRKVTFEDRTVFMLPLAIMVQNRFYKEEGEIKFNPAQRIEQIDYTIKIPDSSNYKIVQIDKIQNEYETINLGDISRDRTNKFGFNSDYGVSLGTKNVDTSETKSSSKETGLKADSSLKFENIETIKETIKLLQEKITIGYSFNSTEINVQQQSKPLSGITKNILLNVRFRLKENVGLTTFLKIANYRNKEGDYLVPSKLEIKYLDVDYIPCSNKNENNFKLDLSYKALIRIVEEKHETVTESDDYVKYIFNEDSIKINPLEISNYKFCEWVWRLRTNEGQNFEVKFKDDDRLSIKNFDTVEEAYSFANYLKDFFEKKTKEEILDELEGASIELKFGKYSTKKIEDIDTIKKIIKKGLKPYFK